MRGALLPLPIFQRHKGVNILMTFVSFGLVVFS
jgi:hypothetical protein